MGTRSSTSPPSLAVVAARVAERIDQLFASEIARWQAVDQRLVEPLQSIRRLVEAGGKRLRPAFCYWGFVGAGGDPDDPRVDDAGAAFEMLHAFALFHDDVMDGSPTRRGAVAAHVEYGERHRRNDWRGEPRRFGEGVAVLIGDLAHVYADLLLTRASAGTNDQVGLIWHEMRLELNVGQYLDILGTARGDRDPVTARRIARYKSGKYTIERPLHVGAALAGRLDELGEALSRYGDPLGEAFQLRDDLLGAFGDEALTGKPVGGDLREGKPTPLLAAATRRATPAQEKVLDLVGMADLCDEEVAAVQQVLVETGAVAEIDASIAQLRSQAVAAIEAADVAPGAAEALVELAEFVATRDA
jgi:geranylgeranyl diphosphate synthase type I